MIIMIKKLFIHILCYTLTFSIYNLSYALSKVHSRIPSELYVSDTDDEYTYYEDEYTDSDDEYTDSDDEYTDNSEFGIIEPSYERISKGGNIRINNIPINIPINTTLVDTVRIINSFSHLTQVVANLYYNHIILELNNLIDFYPIVHDPLCILSENHNGTLTCMNHKVIIDISGKYNDTNNIVPSGTIIVDKLRFRVYDNYEVRDLLNLINETVDETNIFITFHEDIFILHYYPEESPINYHDNDNILTDYIIINRS